MQDRKCIIHAQLLDVMLHRLCHQLIENHAHFEETVLLGLQPRGIYFADRIQRRLKKILDKEIDKGYLDTTFHRDDFRRRDSPLTPSKTDVSFLIEDKNVILLDDVLYTGRSVRAALDAMVTFGRPRKVELMVLIDRKYTRHLPIEPDYVGRAVNTIDSQRVLVEWEEQNEEDGVWITSKATT
ncbi:bifunctional pyr operon transcriptional regulator/uracil phosphoribosyltransferase PyrR [Tunicatimonas pelagia]|uniref:bifunctional pyr operon transcriptional regulator/uracil phosphoribosyltransferase PyrR n=1 Tax=Tunicatimonas pelagia TaxID=931531 RepID=UPI00266524D3|nr:bifunctional pyr operon transcriptional regulator/uracil phosphoribosyltransferase PyrR [Tunicatimonas pelagia]WKN43776.1 bifunctional pyr operon transcriptional regulator/uracil phosphoribosyltransferase PyrR [Tunicatimonas pelagia]